MCPHPENDSKEESSPGGGAGGGFKCSAVLSALICGMKGPQMAPEGSWGQRLLLGWRASPAKGITGAGSTAPRPSVVAEA